MIRRSAPALLLALLVVACASMEERATAPVATIAQETRPAPTPTSAATRQPSPVPTETPEEPAPSPTETPLPTPTPDPLVLGTDGMPWWNDAVFYEIFVRSFQDSDGDGIGDLNGLIDRLDYLNDGDPLTTDDLGITGIWLMPIFESPSYHGYDVVDYYQIDPEYGSNEDFLRLMEEAHARGIRVIVDLVLNHTSRQHPWFQESLDPDSERRDWYVWADESPGYRGPDGQPVWHQASSGFYYGIFGGHMPDLNYETPAVTGAMHEVTRFWLEEMGVDGFRLDAIKFLIASGVVAQQDSFETHAWLESYFDFYKGINPNALAVGEAWTVPRQILEYTGDEVDIAFAFELALDIINSSKVGIGGMVAGAQSDLVENFPPGQYATFITNHDQNRVMSQLDGDVEAAKVAASILLTAPGVPFVYYGEEIGMTGKKPDEDIRLPFPWTSQAPGVGFTSGTPWRLPNTDFSERNMAVQSEDPASLLNHYRSLIHLRNEHEALRIGEWVLVSAQPGYIYAFLRHSERETLLILINPGRNPIDEYDLSLESGPLTGTIQAGLLFGEGEVTQPIVNDAGGFAEYQPLVSLPSQSTFIIQLTSP
jgi:alpha-amylase